MCVFHVLFWREEKGAFFVRYRRYEGTIHRPVRADGVVVRVMADMSVVADPRCKFVAMALPLRELNRPLLHLTRIL